MKIRTDFVTNSSSSGFVVITIQMENNEKIELLREYDTGNGGYFWNSSEASRGIMQHQMGQLRDGYELFQLLRKNIDEFDTFIMASGPNAQMFRMKVQSIRDFGDVNTVRVAETTRFDTGGQKSAEVIYKKKEEIANPVSASCNNAVEHIALTLQEAEKDWAVKTGKEGVILSKYSGSARELTVPAYVDGSPVIAVKGTPAKDLYVAVVNIPDTVKTVDSKAFRGLKCLTAVNIESAETEICSGAFFGCSRLEDENGCIIVGGVLHQCRRKGNVVISSGITRIPHRIAREEFPTLQKYHMKSLVIPEGVEVIESEAFSGQNSLEVVILPSTLKEIGDQAFYECHNLKSVVLPEGIRVIGKRAFSTDYSRLSLMNINFPASLERIDTEAFMYCRNLRATVPNHVPEIGANAFKGCWGMADQDGFVIIKNTLCAYGGNNACVNIPEGVEYITESCFENRKEITEVRLPASLKQFGVVEPPSESKVFVGCTGLADAQGFIVVDGWLWGYTGDSNIIEIPESVKMIHSDVFRSRRNEAPRTVIVPASVTYAGRHAFTNMRVEFRGKVPNACETQMMFNIPDVCYENGFYISGDTLISCNVDADIVEIPSGVKRIIPEALGGKQGASVVLPDTVEILELPQFTGFKTPAEVVIPQRTKIVGNVIGKITVKGWAGSPAETFVKKQAKHCQFVKVGEVTPEWKVKKLKDGTIQLVSYNCHDKEIVSIPEEIDGLPVAILGKELFSGHREIRQIHIPETVTTIEMECFYGVELKELRLPNSLKKIGMMAFEGCGLEVIDIPESLEQIGGGALRDIPTVIIRGNPKLIKNLDIFSWCATVYASPETEAYKYCRSARPLTDLGD